MQRSMPKRLDSIMTRIEKHNQKTELIRSALPIGDLHYRNKK